MHEDVLRKVVSARSHGRQNNLDQSSIVSLCNEGTVGHGEAVDVDVDDVRADLDGRKLDPEPSVALVHHLVRDVRPLLRAYGAESFF